MECDDKKCAEQQKQGELFFFLHCILENVSVNVSFLRSEIK